MQQEEKIREEIKKLGPEAIARMKADAMQKAYMEHINMTRRCTPLNVAEILAHGIPSISERYSIKASTANIVLCFELLCEANKVEYALQARAKQLDMALGVVRA